MINKTPPVIHPFAVGALFVLGCFHQIQPFTNWQELLGIMTLVLGLIYAIFRVLRRCLPEGYKSAILTTLLEIGRAHV